MSIFREYDIRGIFQKDLDRGNVFAIGYYLAEAIKEVGQNQVYIGYDARVHSKELLKWLSDGLIYNGIEVFSLGMIPTPVAYFCVFNQIEKLKITSSIMITGSHNPPEYNGFKITVDQKPFYGHMIQGLKQKIENFMPIYKEANRDLQDIDGLSVYVDYLSKHFVRLRDFQHIVALDYGNGVGGIAMQKILKSLNVKHQALYENPDGNFPNHHPDPSEEKNLQDLKKVMQEKDISIALAFDGDADRIALLTKNHSFKGDELGILFGREIAKQKPNPLVIGEVKCSQIMYDTINTFGRSLMYKTGHSNLKVKLKELDADLAVEMSGHIFFNDRYFGYDDAIYAGLRILELFLSYSVDEIEEMISILPKIFATPEEKISVTEEQKFILIEKLKQKLKNPPIDFPKILDIVDIDGVRVIFEKGWGLVRASNTTPVLVTRFEALDEENALLYKKKLIDLLEIDGLK